MMYSSFSMELLDLLEVLAMYIETALMIICMLFYIYFWFLILNLIVVAVSGHSINIPEYIRMFQQRRATIVYAPQVPATNHDQPVIVATSTPAI